MRPGIDFRRAWWAATAWLLTCASLCAKAPEPAKAQLHVHGMGWVADREQRLTLGRLVGGQRGATLDTNAIEDAAFLLASALEAEGFLDPVIKIEAKLEDGTVERFTFDPTLATPLPRPLAATELTLRVAPGVRSVVKDVRIVGLAALSPEKAAAHFRPGGVLFSRGAARAYTPSRYRAQLAALQDELRQQGYAEAQVRSKNVEIDDRTGEVSLDIAVVEGPRWEVDRLNCVGGNDLALDFAPQVVHRPWTQLWQQDVSERVRRAYYRKGYPEVSVSLSVQPAAVRDGMKPVEVTATIHPGPMVRVGHVRFEGDEHTKESVLRRRVKTQPGDPLDPIALERARYRMSRLGIFSAVDLDYAPPEGDVRDPVFHLVEAPRREANLLLGYGSYEQLRGGVEFRQLNLFGLAHQSRLELVQSMKSSRGDYTYTVPEIFGESVDGAARLFGLQRQEESFLRQEFGVTLALKRALPWLKIEATTGYTYQALRNKDSTLSTSVPNNTDVTVASLDFGLASDRRDNPLRPRHGFRWFVELEAASRALGGETSYQRLESGAAFHTSWGDSRWIHLGVTHGIITTAGADNDLLLPVNKRFFPGGDSSIRGYQEGAASPRAADGRFIGAKTYVLMNLELEQGLTPNWSGVLFADGLGASASVASPFEEKLYSVGLGIRYQTLIGPVRLEYGHNVNPRPGDPSGTLHFSVGYPF